MRVLLIFSITAFTALCGCSRDAALSTGAANPKNDELEQAARNKLAADPQIAGAIHVSADADRNEVSLSGDQRL